MPDHHALSRLLIVSSLVAAAAGATPGTAVATPSPGATAFQGSARIRHEYAAVRASLEPHFDGFYLDDDPRAARWLDRLWTLTGDWVVHYLDARPTATAADVAAAVRALDKDLQASALVIAGNDGARELLVAYERGESGNVFLVDGVDGRHRLAWNIKDTMRSWSAEAARGSCTDDKAEEQWSDCGGWMATLGLLPADAAGHPRFFLDSTRTQYAGMTVSGELTAWAWDGQRAHRQLAEAYAFSMEESSRSHLEGDLLVVRTKGDFRTLFASGGAPERRVERRFRVTPQGIEDAGETSLDPELDLVDELYARLQLHQRTDDIAADEAVGVVAPAIEDWDGEPDEDGLRMGMLMSTPRFAGDTVCISVDGPGDFRFTLSRRDGQLFITRAEAASCEQ